MEYIHYSRQMSSWTKIKEFANQVRLDILDLEREEHWGKIRHGHFKAIDMGLRV